MKQGAAVTVETDVPVEVVLEVGIMQGGTMLTQQQSAPFVLDAGTYLFNESEGDFVINQQDLRSGRPIEPSVYRLEAPHLELDAQHGTTGRLGNPRALHYEPYLADFPNPLKRFVGEGWEILTVATGLPEDASVFVMMVVPTAEAMRQAMQHTPVVLPFTADH